MPVEDLFALTSGVSRKPSFGERSASSPPPQADYDPSDDIGIWRDKVLPSVERRLAGVPPLARIALLSELTAKAMAELAQEHVERNLSDGWSRMR